MNKKNALIIAVDEYDNLDKLEFCKNDGEAIYQVLSSQDYKMYRGSSLIGRVDGIRIRQSIIDFFTDTSTTVDDTLLFYYSGHGIPDEDSDVYLSTSEIDADFPYKHGFSFYELTKMMRKSTSKKIIAILDCCYSGAAGLTKGAEHSAARLGNAAILTGSNTLTEGEGVCILASSQANEEAYALKEQNHSVFSYFLIKGLKGEEGVVDDYGYVTADSLGKFIFNKIMSLPLERRPKQKPIRKMEISREIVVAYYPQYSKKRSLSNLEKEAMENDDVGKRYLERKEYRRALEYYNRLIKDPTQADLWVKKGIVHHKLGSEAEAIRCFETALDFDPTNVLALNSKGIALLNLGRYEESLMCFQMSIDRDPNNENAWFGKGMSLFNLGKIDEALTYIDKSLDVNPKGELALSTKGEIMKKKGNYNKAIEWYEEAIKINPTLPIPWIYKAQVLFDTGRNEEAVECYDRGIDYFENYPVMPGLSALFNSKGNALGNLERHNEAYECYKKAIELDPQNPTYWINKSMCLASMKRFDEVTESTEQALKVCPKEDHITLSNIVTMLGYTGMYYCTQDRFNEAIICFDKGLKLIKESGQKDYISGIKKLAIENPSEAKRRCLQNMNFSSNVSKREIYKSNGKLIEE